MRGAARTARKWLQAANDVAYTYVQQLPATALSCTHLISLPKSQEFIFRGPFQSKSAHETIDVQ